MVEYSWRSFLAVDEALGSIKTTIESLDNSPIFFSRPPRAQILLASVLQYPDTSKRDKFLINPPASRVQIESFYANCVTDS